MDCEIYACVFRGDLTRSSSTDAATDYGYNLGGYGDSSLAEATTRALTGARIDPGMKR